jgi:hypothetical protein
MFGKSKSARTHTLLNKRKKLIYLISRQMAAASNPPIIGATQNSQS